jgi:hypothetical protein
MRSFNEAMGDSRDQAEHLVRKASSYLDPERAQTDADRWANALSAFEKFEQLIRYEGNEPDREEEIDGLRRIVVNAMRIKFAVDPVDRP